MIRQILQDTLSLLLRASPSLLAVALAAYFAAVALCAARWQAIVAGLGGRLALRDAAALLYAGSFAANLTPARLGGELVRAGLVGHRAGLDVRRGAASVAWDRVADLAGIAPLVAIAALTIGGRLVARGHLAWAALAVTVLAVLVGTAARGAVGRMARVLAWAAVGRAAFARAAGLGFAAWVLDLLRYVAIAAALGVPLAPHRAASLSVAQALGGLAPIAGGLGVIDGGLVAALRVHGVSLESALAITAIERAITLLLASAIGAVVLLRMGGRRLVRRLRREAAPSPPTARDSGGSDS